MNNFSKEKKPIKGLISFEKILTKSLKAEMYKSHWSKSLLVSPDSVPRFSHHFLTIIIGIFQVQKLDITLGCTMTLETAVPATLSNLQAESFALVSEVTWIINLIPTDGPNVVLRISRPMSILSTHGV